MLVDGRLIAKDIYREISNIISHLGHQPHLTVFTCAPNFETQRYLSLKRKKAAMVGIAVNVIEFPENTKTEEMIQSLYQASVQTDGIIVQLPFPPDINIDLLLESIPVELDVDGVHYNGTTHDVLPPVVGAIKAIADRERVSFLGRQTVVVGSGRLVGKPVAMWVKALGANVEVINKETTNTTEILKSADIIISGAGQPGLISPESIRDGVIIFDAGTSEEGGELKGDVHPDCVAKAALLTPVPGGIGPITVAILLKNLVRLCNQD